MIENTKSNQDRDAVQLVGHIVAAYISNNSLPASELPMLIKSVHRIVSSLTSGCVSGELADDIEVEKPSPAQIRKSVQQDAIVSFIDGKSYKTLKRHLTANGLNPQSYCERYGLPADYPLVAPSYAARRSAIANTIGLGQRGTDAQSDRKGRKAA